ncbi:translation initiation factor IF-2-like isoform X2 [Onychostruthus taczanowskii]|uniref:translation initiation factor IF-2-like isoform X2 n=1 Tax=Onychostruthus taczanowskii TaxID=356909 RepID=UPI001B806D9D|nr:translation initiation factor IF-2-like isoform X2 [Onychostruthus taczanowskii]
MAGPGSLRRTPRGGDCSVRRRRMPLRPGLRSPRSAKQPGRGSPGRSKAAARPRGRSQPRGSLGPGGHSRPGTPGAILRTPRRPEAGAQRRTRRARSAPPRGHCRCLPVVRDRGPRRSSGERRRAPGSCGRGTGARGALSTGQGAPRALGSGHGTHRARSAPGPGQRARSAAGTGHRAAPARRTLSSSTSRDAELHLPSFFSVGALFICSPTTELPCSCCFPYFKDTLPNVSAAFTFSDSLHFVNKHGLYSWHGIPDKLTLHVLLCWRFVKSRMNGERSAA